MVQAWCHKYLGWCQTTGRGLDDPRLEGTNNISIDFLSASQHAVVGSLAHRIVARLRSRLASSGAPSTATLLVFSVGTVGVTLALPQVRV
jgi:hypothetical protein